MKWQTEIGQLTMAVLRRTTREITPAECVERLTTVLNNVYLQGKIDQIQVDIDKMKATNEQVTHNVSRKRGEADL